MGLEVVANPRAQHRRPWTLAAFTDHIRRTLDLESRNHLLACAPQDVPASPELMTAEWLTHALCHSVPGATVTDFTVEDASSGTSIRHKVTIAYNSVGQAGGLPEHLFTKSTPTLTTRVSNGFTGTMVPEAEFYRQVRHELDIEAPVAVHVAYDTESYRSILLFDDLVARKGASFCTGSSRLERARIEEIMVLLGTLAGRYHQDPRLETSFAWLPTMVEWYVPIHEGIESDKYCELAIDEASDIIPPGFLNRRADFWPTSRRALISHDQHPRTIIHNDSHLGNVYVTAAGMAGMCDWQCICSGLWARDFAYAMSAMVPVEERRLWERDLLATYLDAMHSAASRRIATFDEAWLLYRQQIALALIVWLPTLNHHPDMPDMQPKALSREMVLRMTTAMDDLDSFDA